MFGVVKQFCSFGIWSNTQCITPVDALHTTWSPPLHTVYIPLYLFTEGRGEVNQWKGSRGTSSQEGSKIPTWLSVSPVYKLYKTPVKTTFRVWRFYSFLVHVLSNKAWIPVFLSLSPGDDVSRAHRELLVHDVSQVLPGVDPDLSGSVREDTVGPCNRLAWSILHIEILRSALFSHAHLRNKNQGVNSNSNLIIISNFHVFYC